jgi:hypothetical protein
MKSVICCKCGERVEVDEHIDSETGESYLSVDKTPQGEPICPHCLDAHAPLCGVCEDSHVWNHGEIGTLFIVTPEANLSIREGVYRVIAHPYYWATHFDVNIYASAVKKTNIAPPEVDGSGLRFLCDTCAARMANSK